MRKIVRTVLFVGAALYFAQFLVSAFDFGVDPWKNMVLVLFAVSVLYIFIRPLLAVISMPNRGTVFFFLLFLTTGILFYILTIVLLTFAFRETTLPGVTIFGYNLPSKDLNPLLSLVFSALTTSLTYLFLEELCCPKK